MSPKWSKNDTQNGSKMAPWRPQDGSPEASRRPLGGFSGHLEGLLGGSCGHLRESFRCLGVFLGSMSALGGPEAEIVDFSIILYRFGGPGSTAPPPTPQRARAVEGGRGEA